MDIRYGDGSFHDSVQITTGDSTLFWYIQYRTSPLHSSTITISHVHNFDLKDFVNSKQMTTVRESSISWQC